MFRHSLGVIALIAAVGTPFVASAQTVPTPGQQPYVRPGVTAPQQGPQAHRRRAGDPFMRAMRGLNLSDQQRQQILADMRSSREALRKQIDGVLTDQQRAQLRANLSQQRRAGAGGDRGFGQSGAGQRPMQPQ